MEVARAGLSLVMVCEGREVVWPTVILEVHSVTPCKLYNTKCSLYAYKRIATLRQPLYDCGTTQRYRKADPR